MSLGNAPISSQQELWREIMTLTEAMFQAARTGNWREVEEADRVRQPLIYSFFEQDANPGSVKTIMDDIETILVQDKLISEMGEQRRNRLANSLSGMEYCLHSAKNA